MKKNNQKRSSKKPTPLNKYARFSGMAVQMGVTIGLGAWGGSKLDEVYQIESKLFTIILSLLGIAAGLYLVLKEIIKMQKEDE